MPTDIDAAVGQNIQQARRTANVKQWDLGAKVKISRQQISKYERGVSQIAVSLMVKVADALNIPAATLLPQQNGEWTELNALVQAAKQPKVRWLLLRIVEMPQHHDWFKNTLRRLNGVAKPHTRLRGRPRKRK